MKKLWLTASFVLTAIIVNAQTDSTLQQYTGKYRFPDGTPFSEVVVSIENGTLMGSSSQGSSEFKRREGDIFDIVAYQGTATFRRNSDGKITGLHILVGDIDVEGTKSEFQLSSRSTVQPFNHKPLSKPSSHTPIQLPNG
jgi:hypothetical protein